MSNIFVRKGTHKFARPPIYSKLLRFPQNQWGLFYNLVRKLSFLTNVILKLDFVQLCSLDFELFGWAAGGNFPYAFLTAATNDLNVFLDTLGNAEKACARAIHDECAERLVATNPDLCSSVVDFVGCYNGKVGVKPPSVPAECVVNNIPRVPTISTTFNDLIQAFSTYLIGVYQADQARMCQVHESDLEGDCYAD